MSLKNTVIRRISRYIERVTAPHLRRIKGLLGVHSEYAYSRFSIRLPADHMLPAYQKEHRRYDRFLPHLGEYLQAGSTVIDVGANCGDTLAAMYDTNNGLTYVCIEPDDNFFECLESNIRRIRSIDPSAQIYAHKALIGKSVSTATLVGAAGTKHALVDPIDTTDTKIVSSITLDSLGAVRNMPNVTLLKSDVDGFDYDVLDSSMELIVRQSPILFFECDFATSQQRMAYVATLTTLSRLGYDYWTVFDNYGEVILQTDQIGLLFQLFGYLARQNAGCTTRTMAYIDVLGSTAKHKEMSASAVASYIDQCAG